MCVALHVQEENHSGPIDTKLIAQALEKRNLLRVAESIQISPNGRFCSINSRQPRLCQYSAQNH